MCVCGWPLVGATVLLQLLVIGYGEIRAAVAVTTFRTKRHERDARHRTGEPVAVLRARHDADSQPYYPSPTHKTT